MKKIFCLCEQSIFYFFIALWLEAFKYSNAQVEHTAPLLLLVSVYLIAARYYAISLTSIVCMMLNSTTSFVCDSFVRVVAGYHTFNQVAVGCVLGLIFGYIGCEIIHRPSVYAVVRSMGAPPLWIKLLLITAAAAGLFGKDIIKQALNRKSNAETKLQ